MRYLRQAYRDQTPERCGHSAVRAPVIDAIEIQPPVSASQVCELLDIDPEFLVSCVREGLPFDTLERVQRLLDVPMNALAPVLHTTSRSLRRRRQEGNLSPEESIHLVRLARIVQLALWVYEDEDRAVRWLTTPKRMLDGETPLEYSDTEPGAEEVTRMLYAIEFSLPA